MVFISACVDWKPSALENVTDMIQLKMSYENFESGMHKIYTPLEDLVRGLDPKMGKTILQHFVLYSGILPQLVGQSEILILLNISKIALVAL